MTPLSCLYHEYLRRYGRREVDFMVALIFCNREEVDGFGGGVVPKQIRRAE
jgi:hypothetical protein